MTTNRIFATNRINKIQEYFERRRNKLMTDDAALDRFIAWVLTEYDCDHPLPTTIEMVAKAMQEIDEDDVVLPEGLRDPMAILDRSAVTWEERTKRVQERVIEALRKAKVEGS